MSSLNNLATNEVKYSGKYVLVKKVNNVCSYSRIADPESVKTPFITGAWRAFFSTNISTSEITNQQIFSASALNKLTSRQALVLFHRIALTIETSPNEGKRKDLLLGLMMMAQECKTHENAKSCCCSASKTLKEKIDAVLNKYCVEIETMKAIDVNSLANADQNTPTSEPQNPSATADQNAPASGSQHSATPPLSNPITTCFYYQSQVTGSQTPETLLANLHMLFSSIKEIFNQKSTATREQKQLGFKFFSLYIATAEKDVIKKIQRVLVSFSPDNLIALNRKFMTEIQNFNHSKNDYTPLIQLVDQILAEISKLTPEGNEMETTL